MTNARAVFKEANVAVITGSASGIGLAAAKEFARRGMSVVLADLEGERLSQAFEETVALAESGVEQIAAIEVDVSKLDTLEALERTVMQRFGRVHVLMNNAGVQPGSSIFGPQAPWDNVLTVNLMGVVNGTRTFGPGMIAHGEPAMIINTGSKQGITTPPGDPAYNVAKAGVKVFTEALQHELRNREKCAVSSHLLIPGFVFTAMTANGRTEKPAGAWTPEETVAFMMERLHHGDFYILCPDNDVDRSTDERRILWAAHDIVENRPPLSRWHVDFSESFRAFLTDRNG